MEQEVNSTDTGAKEAIVAEPTMEQVAQGIQPEVAPQIPKEVPKPEEETTTKEATPASDVNTKIEAESTQDAVQKRINEITKAKYAEQRRADELQLRLDALDVAKKKVDVPTGAPQIEDFDYDDDLHKEALIKYEVQKQMQSAQDEVNKQHIAQVKVKTADEFGQKEVAYIKEHPEYAEIAPNLPHFQEDTLSAIYELGPQVSHYLAKHLDVAYELAGASPTMAAVRLGQISMGLSPDNKQVKPSTAPDPVKTIAGGGAVSKSQDEMSMDEIMALPN